MTEKIVTARRDYICSFCERPVEKGDKHRHGKARGPRFDDDCETQVGIEYVEWRLCLDVEECNGAYWKTVDQCNHHPQNQP